MTGGDTMLNQVMKMLNLPEDRSVYAEFALDKATTMIKNYCHLSEVPDGLRFVCVSMAMDIYRAEHLGNAEAGLIVKSITEGNISTSFESQGRKIGADDQSAYLTPYIGQLNCYRRLAR